MIKSAAIFKNGIIYTGKRHCDILCDRSRPFGFLKFGQQGFVDEDGNFLTRAEAAKHAYECGQIDVLKRKLYSEDLY